MTTVRKVVGVGMTAMIVTAMALSPAQARGPEGVQGPPDDQDRFIGEIAMFAFD